MKSKTSIIILGTVIFSIGYISLLASIDWQIYTKLYLDSMIKLWKEILITIIGGSILIIGANMD